MTLIRLLLKYGADTQVKNNNGQTAIQLTDREDVLALLKDRKGVGKVSNGDEMSSKCESRCEAKCESNCESKLPLIPNYLSNPVFPYNSSTSLSSRSPGNHFNNFTASTSAVTTDNSALSATTLLDNNNNDLVLKVRVADSDEKDFYEIDVRRGSTLTFDLLMSAVCDELNVDRANVRKLRKLPDTIIRKDRDVERLRDFQELELVLK